MNIKKILLVVCLGLLWSLSVLAKNDNDGFSVAIDTNKATQTYNISVTVHKQTADYLTYRLFRGLPWEEGCERIAESDKLRKSTYIFKDLGTGIYVVGIGYPSTKNAKKIQWNYQVIKIK